MHHMAESDVWRLHRGEVARQVEMDRMSRRLRASVPGLALLARFAGRSGRRVPGGSPAAG